MKAFIVDRYGSADRVGASTDQPCIGSAGRARFLLSPMSRAAQRGLIERRNPLNVRSMPEFELDALARC